MPEMTGITLRELAQRVQSAVDGAPEHLGVPLQIRSVLSGPDPRFELVFSLGEMRQLTITISEPIDAEEQDA